MQVWYGGRGSHSAAGAAVTIGNFDGVHRGHQVMMQRLRRAADEYGVPAVAVVFEPQPAEFFARRAGAAMPYRLTPLRDKLALLEATGCLNAVWVVRFCRRFADMPAQDFIDRILVERLHTRYLLVGDDFRFGAGRSGDFALLRAQASFATEETPSVLVDGERASSTAVRRALSAGDLVRARELLGHDYILSGRVKYGAQIGRTLDCPTANIHLPPHHYAPGGVFVVEAEGAFGSRRGVASFGTNPTVSDTPQQKLEVHLFDFSGSLYGQRVKVRFLHKLRDEAAFDGLDALRAQIHADMEAARAWQP